MASLTGLVGRLASTWTVSTGVSSQPSAYQTLTFQLPGGTPVISNFPSGSWKVKVWYQDGFLESPVETVQVEAKRPTKPVKLTIPARLPTPAAR